MTMQEFFIQNPTAAVAFSGGVDSAWLLHEARTWARRTAAYFVRTPFQPDFELEDARDIARRLDVPLTVLAFDVLSVPQAAANPPDRCYHCKRALFTRLMEAAGADGFPWCWTAVTPPTTRLTGRAWRLWRSWGCAPPCGSAV